MPQPLSRIVSDADISLQNNALSDKPEMAALVTEIFAIWAGIEHALSLLLVRVLGAVESPAIAIYEVLTAQHLQNKALEAAAKATLPKPDYNIFLAVISSVNRAQAHRNRLAHWLWGMCPQRPDLLVLVDPKMVRERNLRLAKIVFEGKSIKEFIQDQLFFFDTNNTLCYSKAALSRAKAAMDEADQCLRVLEFYLNPQIMKTLDLIEGKNFDPDGIREFALGELNQKRSFREALDQICASQQSKPQPPSISPQPTTDE